MPQISLEVNDSTIELIQKLKKAFGVTTNAAVIRKALALGGVAADNARDNAIEIKSKDDETMKILLTG